MIFKQTYLIHTKDFNKFYKLKVEWSWEYWLLNGTPLFPNSRIEASPTGVV